MTQKEALTILKTGANVFLTGEPGSGKTHTINEYVAYLRSHDVKPAITASTGIAATHIGGHTLHSFFGLGIRNKFDKYEIDRIANIKRIAKRILRTKVLIIDEVSMLTSDVFAAIDAVIREVLKSFEPFGGIQIILVGDFFQLPPIIKNDYTEQASLIEEIKSRFIFNSSAWSRLNPVTCYLSEQYRQDDPEFLSVLSAIRADKFNKSHLDLLEKRKNNSVSEDIPKLFSHNEDVDRINNEKLLKLSGEPKMFEMRSVGPEALVANLKKGCLSPERLVLKIGAAVMFTKNNSKEGFVNGTLGVVVGFEKGNNFPIIKTKDNREITVLPMEFTIEDAGKALAALIQMPLRLAWAITIHKSQGMSLDGAAMDLSKVFEYGAGYVALSRVRRLSGLHLLGWNDRAAKVNPEILLKDKNLKDNSNEARKVFGGLPDPEITKMHKNFIAFCKK
ncbi:hypothetical protein A2645_00800 [Candidatus Nomurabacteria bacterium RIFCSPHIGHO2_01_FULL_39_9]|uniref:AAA+ ATPase domain-containing protein n=1 Tax=Candidatus Nomurabacteria bacterium RIFCSPHIGHO2_01_FULL_39_9 TaxID=1801735 RepID=A0A1F6UVZ3_9BACT|nr:MAG: hypothetical protein A2645_00800 [Candidatus Nomurabacteria bacterium RIFCSPHIGHO2_01_FULL_39_9]